MPKNMPKTAASSDITMIASMAVRPKKYIEWPVLGKNLNYG